MTSPLLGSQDGVDLHLHTVVSDGRWTADELVQAVAAAGVRLMAVTDHDATDAVAPAQRAAAARGLAVLPGVELTAGYRDEFFHLLAFGIDPAWPPLAALLADVHRREHARSQALLDQLLKRGLLRLNRFELDALRQEPRLTQAKLVLVLKEHGYPDVAAYRGVLRSVMTGGFTTTPIEQIVATLRPYGVPLVVAHPGGPMLEYEEVAPNLTSAHLRELLAARLMDGLEVYTPKHGAALVDEFNHLVAEFDLLVSCGSDAHGASGAQPTPYPARRCAALLERCGIPVTG